MRLSLLASLLAFSPAFASGEGGEWQRTGEASIELRLFGQEAAFAGQHGQAAISGALEPEISYGRGNWSARVRPFVRLDAQDKHRSHFDVREAYWETASDRWELRIGIRKVYWGVTESVHLVDQINQIDQLENIDGEDRLGQPMANFAWISDYGTLDLFALIGFRERRFPGVDGRLRPGADIDEGGAIFESTNGNEHTDWAARYSHSLGDWDLGLSQFYGLSRDPSLVLSGGGLVPLYEKVHQTSIDVQWTKNAWLWKLEAINRSGQGDRFRAAVFGYEYTFNGLIGSADLGILTEYQWDERGKRSPSPADDDIFAGARIAVNDEMSTEFLGGMVQDLDTQTRFINVEASRRVGESWKLVVESRIFSGVHPADPLVSLAKDDYLEIGLIRYF